MPLPAITNGTAAIPYPCQYRRCGCSSSGQCWAGDCCCYSIEEKIAWAKANDVAVPAIALEAARRSNRERRPAAKSIVVAGKAPSAPRSCCASHAPKPATVELDSATPASSCCCKAKKAAPKPVAPSNSCPSCTRHREKSLTRLVATLEAAKCQGFSGDVLGLIVVDVPPTTAGQSLGNAPSDLILPRDLAASLMAVRPPTPPPRFSIS
ncbi:hypothetical protein Pan216_54900 [Planctomycetes bacterium Pan216]|uniref:Uncharacterized protein n=1 Tax=Kolteria novifilia TaxID=2527975 RepID=A0A518BC80_9BACT|nr:hypothetical protein Pan216_54900 [Planctomycetes bacterium Pan216]